MRDPDAIAGDLDAGDLDASDLDGGELDIGEVVARSGLPISTLHLWEARGLIAPIGRHGLRRTYAHDVLDRLAIIVICQRSGFSLREIGDLLAPDAFGAGKDQLTLKLAELEARRDELNIAIEGLRHALDCAEPNPLQCEHFRQHLPTVLPVHKQG